MACLLPSQTRSPNPDKVPDAQAWEALSLTLDLQAESDLAPGERELEVPTVESGPREL